MYAAYKSGALPLDLDLNPQEFDEYYGKFMQNHYQYAWVLQNDKPFGLFFGNDMGEVIHGLDMIWYPWATHRNKLEGMLKFITVIRKKKTFVWTSEDKRFFNHICSYGVARRVGTLQLKGKTMAVYQTGVK